MFTRPDEPTDTQLAEALQEGWGLPADEFTYLPVGFGSYHWKLVSEGRPWFVTVDDLTRRQRRRGEPLEAPRRRLGAALRTAMALRDAGLSFVVAPRPTRDGDPTWMRGPRLAIAVYPHIEGTTYGWGAYASRQQRLAVVDRLVTLHATVGRARTEALVDDLAIPSLDGLQTALADRHQPWEGGPYAEPARQHLVEHADALSRALHRFDRLASEVRSQTDRMVVTHGEPHRANTIETVDGVMLIDWDTALLAPPERDLWMLVDEDPAVAEVYAERAGVEPDRRVLETYRLWWDLSEVADYVTGFRGPHQDTEDTRTAWEGLRVHCDPARW